MKMLKKLFALTLIICMAVSVAAFENVFAAENLLDNMSSNNFGMYALPKKGEVNIDANFDDWDWSGRIMIFPNFDTISTKGAEVAVMYDESFLYLGFKVKDETPLRNTRDPILEWSNIWRGDSFQIRTKTDHMQWITTGYHKNTEQASFHIADFYGDNEASGEKSSVLYYTSPGSTFADNYLDVGNIPKGSYSKGMEIAAKEDTQLSGTYYYEAKIPYDALYYDSTKYPKAGDIMTMAFEVYWSDETGYNVGSNYKDNLKAGTTSREFFWRKPDIWGDITFLDHGDIELRNYAKDKVLPMSGYLQIPIEVPKDKDTITVVIENSKGERIRNIISELDYKEFEEYKVSETDTTWTVNILWDGRDDFGNKVSPGNYTFRTIAYTPLDPVFDSVYYGPGQIPWSTTASNSGWLADHTPPRTVAAYGDEVYVGAAFAEGGHGLMALSSENGEKLWGTTLGAHTLEVNSKYIYAIPGWDWTQDMTISLNQILLRYDRTTGKYNVFEINGEKQPLQMYMSDILGVKNGESVPNITGLAVNEEYIAIATNGMTGTAGMDITYFKTALSYPDAVQIYDGEDLTPKKRIYVPQVGGIEYSKDGKHLYAISGQNEVVEINTVTGKLTALPLKGIDKTVTFSVITTDNNGNVVLFDSGEDCQIKAYNPTTGQLVYKAAQEGGRPYDGAWEEQGLTPEVSDMAVDNNGNIWVTEDWNYPRRISKWSAKTGLLIDDYIGSTFYMGGNSSVSDYDADLVYWGPVEMRINRENLSYEVERILYIPDPLKGEMFPMDSGGNAATQQFESDASGTMRKYAFGQGVLYIETESGRYRPCFAIGSGTPAAASYNKTPQYDSTKIADYAAAVLEPWNKDYYATGYSTNTDEKKWIWNDNNCDGKVQNGELQFFDASYQNIYWNATNFLPTSFNWSSFMTDSMSFTAYNAGGNYYYGTAMVGIYSPAGFHEDGSPYYDLAHLKLVNDPALKGQGAEHYYFEDEGTVVIIPAITTMNDPFAEAIRCINVETGELEWTYRNDHPGVAGSHSSPMQPDNGFIIGPLKIMGIYHNSQGDKFIHIRGNVGTDYLVTSDGFFVSTLFQDNRLVRISLPDDPFDTIGKSLNHVSTGGEPFGGNGATHSDGVTRFILPTGGRCAVVCSLENLDSIERLDPVTVTFTREDLDAAYAYVEEKPGDEGKKEEKIENYEIMKATDGFVIDGELTDWDGFPSLTVAVDGAEERSNVKLAWNTENLYLSFDTTDNSPMKNTGVDFNRLFKTGDVADLYLSPSGNKTDKAVDGDLRLTFSVYEGKEVAVLSKLIDSSSDGKYKNSVSSPVRTIEFDVVKILPDAEIGIIRTDTGYSLEAKVPLSSLGIKVDTSKMMSGDVGIIKGDAEGTVNLARIYFFNKHTGLISDLPGEADFYPQYWGGMQFVDKDPRIDS